MHELSTFELLLIATHIAAFVAGGMFMHWAER